MVKPLRDRGIKLITASRGEIEWNSLAGQLGASVNQFAKIMESLSISRRVLTGMLRHAQDGKRFLGRRCPYGYTTEAIPREDRPGKVYKRMIPGDPVRVQAVRDIFRLYAEGNSLESIRQYLERENIPVPRTKGRKAQTLAGWGRGAIHQILTCRKYLGEAVWAKRTGGKYHKLDNSHGVIENTGRKRNMANPEFVIKTEAHEPLIDRELWEKVQAARVRNRKRTTPLPAGTNGYYLTGMLVCGCCGMRMLGAKARGKQRYKCGGYSHYGKEFCTANYITEETLYRGILKKLESTFQDEDIRQQMLDEARRLADEDRPAPGNAAALKAQMEKLDREIAAAARRMLTVPEDLQLEAAAVVRGLKEERQAAQKQLERLRTESRAISPELILAAVNA